MIYQPCNFSRSTYLFHFLQTSYAFTDRTIKDNHFTTISVLLNLNHATLGLNNPVEEALQKHVGKGENASKQYFHHFPQCFLP